MEIEFISYDGSFPNLCSGQLKLRINGRLCVFGINLDKFYTGAAGNWEAIDKINKFYLPRFWTSGGTAYIDHKGDEHVGSGPWELMDVEFLPKSLQPHAQELIDVFNENVPWGCCGGCI